MNHVHNDLGYSLIENIHTVIKKEYWCTYFTFWKNIGLFFNVNVTKNSWALFSFKNSLTCFYWV